MSAVLKRELVEGEKFLNYQILKPLGKGGMGAVFLAKDINLEREVAIKTLLPEADENVNLKKRFHNEAKALAALNHPNIVSIHNYGVEDSVSYIVMEYVKGRDLSDLIHSRGFGVSEALSVLRSMASALSEAHENGILHRDIKPSNIVINEKGIAKLVDFGIAKSFSNSEDDLTRPDRIVGTVNYLSPEVIIGARQSVQSDLFALGIVFFEMLTKKNPFVSENRFKTMENIKNIPVELPEDIREILPAQFVQLFRDLVSKNPETRIKSSAELLKRIEDCRLGDIPHELLISRRPELKILNEHSVRMRLLSQGFKTREIGIIISLAAQFQEQNVNDDKTRELSADEKLSISSGALDYAVNRFQKSKKDLTYQTGGKQKAESKVSINSSYLIYGIGIALLVLAGFFGFSYFSTVDAVLAAPPALSSYKETSRRVNLTTGAVLEDSINLVEFPEVMKDKVLLKWSQEGTDDQGLLEKSYNDFVHGLKTFGPSGEELEVTIINGDYNKIYPLEVGKDMSYKFVIVRTDGRPKVEGQRRCQVKGRQMTKVPAGEFDTFVVNCEDTDTKGEMFFKETFYYSPKVFRYVKRSTEWKALEGEMLRTMELVSYNIP